MSSLQLTPCQSKALHLLYGEENIFLTGAAGTGKSFLLQQFLSHKPVKSHPILASTGTAALLVDGRTFHSFFGIGIMEGGRRATVERVVSMGRSAKRIREAECLVIDEVSMLSGETLAAAEEIARHVREDHSPWGGLRIIAVGDFAQLPPIQSGGNQRDWAFAHNVWTDSKFTSIYLKTSVRTTEENLISLLNTVRSGIVNDDVHMFLDRKTYEGENHFEGTRLFPRRQDADTYNRTRLDTLNTALHEFPTEYTGDARSIEHMKKQSPIPEVLAIKIGALVMLRKNDTAFPYKYVNGSLGVITAITLGHITVRLLGGKTVNIEPEIFSLLDGNGKKRASAENFPIILAWATTIHKAQGASIDRLLVSISGLWESGHAYVALSRATNEEGLFIENWEPRSIFIDPLVQQFYKDLQKNWESMSELLPNTTPDAQPPQSARKKKDTGIPSYKQTAALLKDKKSLSDIAEALGRKESTIVGHIEKLLTEEVEDIDIHYLRPEAEIFHDISASFDEHGTEFLKPVYDQLQGRYSYDLIRSVRLHLL